MSEKPVKIGFDRFIALEWADYALELYLTNKDEEEKYCLLKDYLQHEIIGTESARKTANQLKRLWLNKQDEYQGLRSSLTDIVRRNIGVSQAIFHYGVACNVFPIFKTTCRKIGEVAAVQSDFNKNIIVDRVSRDFLNPSSIPRIVSRVIQTLGNWNLIHIEKDRISVCQIPVEDTETGLWFIQALLYMGRKKEISVTNLNVIPEKMGINLIDMRSLIQSSDCFSSRRNVDGDELITMSL